MIIIGIDPGQSGGIAVKDAFGIIVHPMPETRGDVIKIIRDVGVGPAVAYIEKVAPFIPGGGASQMFEFGRQYERVGCICETLGIRLIEVRPHDWQAFFHLPKPAKTKADKDATKEAKKVVSNLNAKAQRDWKNILKAEAQRRFPNIEVTLKTADALLILDYAMAQVNGGSTIQPTTNPKDNNV